MLHAHKWGSRVRINSIPWASSSRTTCQKRAVGSFRHNICTSDWIAFPGDERMRRPRSVSEMGKFERAIVPEESEECPFCPTRRDSLPPPLLELESDQFTLYKQSNMDKLLEKPDQPFPPPIDNYKLIVVPNKYPVVAPTHCLVDPDSYPTTVLGEGDFYCDQMVECFGVAEAMGQRRLSATGFHEVLVDHPNHRFTLADSNSVYWEMIFRAFRDRSRILSQSSLIQTVLCFKNHGFFAGASIAHPHAQMIALPIVPSRQEKRQELAREHYRLHGKCLFCDFMQFELREKVRVVAETSDFVAVIPFAANIPYHTTIFPKRHNHQFNNTSDEDLESLAEMVHIVFEKINTLLGDSDFNLVVRSAHLYRSRFHVYDPKCFYHWYVEIYPRLCSWPVAGFEFGSGILCNSHLPEDDAEALRTGHLKSAALW